MNQTPDSLNMQQKTIEAKLLLILADPFEQIMKLTSIQFFIGGYTDNEFLQRNNMIELTPEFCSQLRFDGEVNEKHREIKSSILNPNCFIRCGTDNFYKHTYIVKTSIDGDAKFYLFVGKNEAEISLLADTGYVNLDTIPTYDPHQQMNTSPEVSFDWQKK
jgi:hypothetical protein